MRLRHRRTRPRRLPLIRYRRRPSRPWSRWPRNRWPRNRCRAIPPPRLRRVIPSRRTFRRSRTRRTVQANRAAACSAPSRIYGSRSGTPPSLRATSRDPVFLARSRRSRRRFPCCRPDTCRSTSRVPRHQQHRQEARPQAVVRHSLRATTHLAALHLPDTNSSCRRRACRRHRRRPHRPPRSISPLRMRYLN